MKNTNNFICLFFFPFFFYMDENDKINMSWTNISFIVNSSENKQLVDQSKTATL